MSSCSIRKYIWILTVLTFQIDPSHTVDVEYPGKTATKIAFGSCHKIKNLNATDGVVWDAIGNTRPDAFLWTGDSIYPSKKGTAPVLDLISSYQKMHNNPKIGYSSFITSNPLPLGIHGTWDDHDYGGNDKGNDTPNKSDRANAFFDFLNVSNHDPRRKRTNGGVYSSISFGDAPNKVLVLLLDTRSFRSQHCIPSLAAVKFLPLGNVLACFSRWFTAGINLPAYFKSCRNGQMLGEEQWEWLEHELMESDAQAHIIVSSVQILTSNPIVESWGHFENERQRLLNLLTHRKDGKMIPGIALLSGDVHYAEILSSHPNHRHGNDSKLNDFSHHREDNPLLEVTSSGLTHSCVGPIYGFLCKPMLNAFHTHRFGHHHNKDEMGREEETNYFTERNFGSIEINWKDDVDPVGTMTINIHDHYGNIVLSTGKKMLSLSTYLSREQISNIASFNDGHLIPFIQSLCWILFGSIFVLLLLLQLKTRPNKEKIK